MTEKILLQTVIRMMKTGIGGLRKGVGGLVLANRNNIVKVGCVITEGCQGQEQSESNTLNLLEFNCESCKSIIQH